MVIKPGQSVSFASSTHFPPGKESGRRYLVGLLVFGLLHSVIATASELRQTGGAISLEFAE